ncbi:MAG: heme-copper oxidase subunit III [Candidatus Eisenbacteria bacterium]|nr:heme-copper oxidase subunit III [Candidatus Eisenbacteria bacterium]
MSEERTVPGAGRLGMWLLIASLSILFVASLIGYLAVRARAEQWPPPGLPPLPSGLWISTVIILLCSLAIETALRAVRRQSQGPFLRALLATFLLGIVFLASQALNWSGLIAAHAASHANLYTFTFFMLTGLHAAHVIGGLIPLGIVLRRACSGRYTAERHAGVGYCQMYWHFLGAVWLVMFCALLLFS